MRGRFHERGQTVGAFFSGKKAEAAGAKAALPQGAGAEQKMSFMHASAAAERHDDLIEYRVSPLPDVLEDHTLLATDRAGRLAEYLRRWTQFVRSLWWLHDSVTYRLCFSTNGDGREVQIALVADADAGAHQQQLDSHLHGLLTSARIAAIRRPVTRAMSGRWQGFEVRQRVQQGVWQTDHGPLGLTGKAGLPASGMGELGWMAKELHQKPPVPFPWRGPGGTFQLPVATLLDLGVEARMEIHLRPVRLTDPEREFLRIAAAAAESKGGSTHALAGGHGQVRDADPAAHMAAELYLSQYRRLTNPFLVSVHCLARTEQAARSLAAVVEALVLEPPLEGHDPRGPQLPAGATVTRLADDSAAIDVARFPRTPGTNAATLDRLAYLADAAGAATVFRLPVSVQGGVPGIETRQMSPDYNPGPMPAPCQNITATTPRGERVIVLGALESGGIATIAIDDLTKHTLVTGFTGSGKTVTVLQILDQLWRVHGVPFLVLESAKQEYRGFYGVPGVAEDLRVYTLGNERGVPFRLNPFELLPGERVESRIGRLQVCLEGAIPPIGPSSSVIAETLVRVYARRGWGVVEVFPEDESGATERRRFPTLSDFVDEISRVLRDRRYEGELLGNLTAALVGRLRPLLLGSKGRMFDCQVSVPSAQELFSHPTVLEMNDLNLDDKALVVMFILSMLREYRDRDYRLHPEQVGQLRHVTMVEEAHNVLAEVGSTGGSEGSADTRYKAVEAFCQLLTEVRALGEGLMIADQSPEKLARDAMRNTNLQIAHQLRDSADRDAVARAMIMTAEQRDFIGKLLPGRAALFRTGLERATFVQVPPYYGSPDPERAIPDELVPFAYRGAGFARTLTIESVQAEMARVTGRSIDTSTLLPLAGCAACREQCRHRGVVHADIEGGGATADLTAWREQLRAAAPLDDVWRHIVTASVRGATRAGCAGGDGPWCYFVHLWHLETGTPLEPAARRPDDEAFRKALASLEASAVNPGAI
jgi:hypothetical protein